MFIARNVNNVCYSVCYAARRDILFLKKLRCNRERDKIARRRRDEGRKIRKSSNEKTFDQTIVSIRSERKKNTLQLQRYDRFRRYDKHCERKKEKFFHILSLTYFQCINQYKQRTNIPLALSSICVHASESERKYGRLSLPVSIVENY